MTDLVHIEPGQWVLAYIEDFYPGHHDGDMARALERLVDGGSGWTCLYKPSDQFDVVQVEHVMLKLVMASASTSGEMLALRGKLFGIGYAADRAIEEETARRMAEFVAKTRADAMAKVHAALPHIFGKPA